MADNFGSSVEKDIILSTDSGFCMDAVFHKTSKAGGIYSSLYYSTKNTKEKQSVFLRDEAVISKLQTLHSEWKLEWKRIVITVTLEK